MPRVQLALRVSDLDASITFYTKLLACRLTPLRLGLSSLGGVSP